MDLNRIKYLRLNEVVATKYWNFPGEFLWPHTQRVRTIARPLPLERELPYFTNRTSVLRHRSNLSRNNGTGHRHTRAAKSDTADETESSSNNSLKNSRSASVLNNGPQQLRPAAAPHEDDHDLGPSSHHLLIV